MVNLKLVQLTLSASGTGFCLLIVHGFHYGDYTGSGELDL